FMYFAFAGINGSFDGFAGYLAFQIKVLGTIFPLWRKRKAELTISIIYFGDGAGTSGNQHNLANQGAAAGFFYLKPCRERFSTHIYIDIPTAFNGFCEQNGRMIVSVITKRGCG